MNRYGKALYIVPSLAFSFVLPFLTRKSIGTSSCSSTSPENSVPTVAKDLLFFIHGQRCKVFVIWYGNLPRVVVSSPDLVKEIFFDKSSHFHGASDLLAAGLLTHNGEKWARHRGILKPGFSKGKPKETFSAFSSSCTEMISRWNKLVGPCGHRELDASIELRQLIKEIHSKTIYGSNYAEVKRIFELQAEQSKLSETSLWEIYFPAFSFATEANIRKKNIHAEVTSMLMNLMSKRLEEMKVGNPSNDNVLGVMLESYISSTIQEDGDSKEVGMSIEDILEECRLLSIAHDTTLALVTWAMVALAMHPLWQNRARDEILQLCGKQIPTFDNLNQLKIVTMILYEVLRLYRPLPLLLRRTYKSATIGNYALPAGVEVLIPILPIHHDKEIWGDDSDKFDPERFSKGVSNASKHQVGFIPFGWGPRICLGQAFAITGAQLAPAMILQHFSFELSPSYVHAPYVVASVQPQHGAPLILRQL
ncbi:Ent-kaurene oxidase-like 5 [Nymphaea thermarum]|nr:Ent-kaurene oxidase-like 5 [Nymphaea thermarum]